ncbi:lanthionine synthetase C family protein [Spirosoma koreense]
MIAFERTSMVVDKAAIERKLAQLRYQIESSAPKNDTLLSGRIGRMVYYFYLFRYYQDELFGERGVAILEEVVQHIQDKTAPYLLRYPFSYGLSGFGYAMSLLIEEGIIDIDFDEQLTEFDEIIYQAALPDLSNGNTDYLHGAPGAMLYLSRRLGNPAVRVYLEEMVTVLDSLAIRDERGLRFPNTHIARLNESDNINFGLAHGLCGILLVLLRVYQQGVARPVIERIVSDGIQYILSYRTKPDPAQNRFSQFPLTIDETKPWDSPENSKEYNARLGWCYGDLNEMLLFYQAGAILGRPDWVRLADEVGEGVIQRHDPHETIIKDSHLCHGSAGIAQYYKRFYDQTGHQAYADAYQFWLGKTVQYLEKELTDAAYTNHAGELLEGFVGSSLVLLSAVGEENYVWDRIFLLC